MGALPYISWATSLTQARNPQERDVLGELHEWGKKHWKVRFLPKKERAPQRYSGNELSLTQESVRRVCIIWKKYQLSYLEMTSELHRPPLSTG